MSLCVSDQMNVPAKNHDTCQKGLLGKKGWRFSGEGVGLHFLQKNEVQSEIFNNKKGL